MATFSAVFTPGPAIPTKITALASSASSAEVALYADEIFAVVATGNCQITFGQTGMGAATATGWLIPSGSVHQFSAGSSWQAVRFYNPTGGAIDIYLYPFVRQ